MMKRPTVPPNPKEKPPAPPKKDFSSIKSTIDEIKARKAAARKLRDSI